MHPNATHATPQATSQDAEFTIEFDQLDAWINDVKAIFHKVQYYWPHYWPALPRPGPRGRAWRATVDARLWVGRQLSARGTAPGAVQQPAARGVAAREDRFAQ